MLRPALLAACALAALTTAAVAADAPKPRYGDWGFDAAGVDKAVHPGDDFWRYANGTWDRSTAIPGDKTGYGVDYILSDGAETQVRTILQEPPPASATGGEAADAAKVHAAFQAFMDADRIEAAGAAPLQPDRAAIRAAKTRGDLAELMGTGHGRFFDGVFGVYVGADEKAPTRYALYLGQDGLGLPDRDYYLQPQFASKLAAYRKYVAQMLTLAGWPDAEHAAAGVVDLETRIAKVSWSRAEERDPDKTYNPTSPADLAKSAPGFAWARYMKGAGLAGETRVVVQQNTAFPKIAAAYAATLLPQLKAWMAFHAVDDAAPILARRFEQAHFAFHGTVLGGQPQQRERWKRGVQFVNRTMGEAVGRVYVARHFPPDAKSKIDALVSELKVALNGRIDGLDWMSPETKAKAHAKLAKFTVKIAYPETWRDYTRLEISAGDLAGDTRRAGAFEWRRELDRLHGPVDRREWGMTPQTVNAYYNPTQNEIVFPAAILQPPYFDPNADAAANYGGIGGVIGHEMTHGFDDQGRKYDGDGVLTNWWTPTDAQRFEGGAKTLGGQFDTYSPFPGMHVNGALTMGENIADLGGILVALDAYHLSLHGRPAPVIDGLTGDQRFFLAYAQSWRDKRREDSVRQQVVSDPHSPEVYRVNGIVRNVDAWYAAFAVKPADALFLKPDQRARIW